MAHAAYAAPQQQTMTAGPFSSVPGFAIRQVSQWGEAIAQAFGIPWEQKNKYKIIPIPPGQHARKTHDQSSGYWAPKGEELEQLPTWMMANEESSFGCRLCLNWMGCGNLRAFKMHIMDPQNPGAGDVMLIDRPFKCGAGCCQPLETKLTGAPGAPQQEVGMVREDCDPCCGKCMEASCCCIYYSKVTEAGQHKYSLQTSLCCCGDHNNCCGATCCKHDLLISVKDPDGKVVGHIQQTYAPDNGCGACCRMMNKFTNYVVEFPPNASETERRLLLTAVFHLDYQHFEKTGDENDN